LGIVEGITSIGKLPNPGKFIAYTVLIWTLYIIGTWVGFKATAGTEILPLSMVVAALAFASIGMIITPGGIGAYAWLMAIILELKGIPNEIGLANGTLQWFAQFIIVLIVGFVCMGLLPWYNKKISHEKS
jgi:glycosyltransferase 2 family protein